MGGGRSDAIEARDRCREALFSETDVTTAQALWRCMGKYHRRGCERLESPAPRTGFIAVGNFGE
jgi:hypothetical protein